MPLQLSKIEDPRDNLEKAHRKELENWAKANGVTEIKQQMPAILMRQILRSRGLHNIPIPRRTLGQVARSNSVSNFQMPDAPAQSAVDIMKADWERVSNDVGVMTMQEIRHRCKEAGIAMKRTDKKADLVEKLNGKNAS